MNKLHRLGQVFHYGWLHAGQISEKKYDGKRQISLFLDIIAVYRKYGMWSNQYLKERFWELDKAKRAEKGEQYKAANKAREEWVKDFYENRKFIAKWSRYEIEASPRQRELRNEAYSKRYGMGKGVLVEHGVELSRQHYLPGELKVGNYVLLGKDVFIDYSGEVILCDDVKLSAGVRIESHLHEYIPGSTGTEYNAKPTKIEIGNGTWIGTGAIICESCGRIGRFAQIGAGAVVRNNIPPYSLVVGNPAKIVGFVFTPEEMIDFERTNYPNLEPTDITKYEKCYNKYFVDRISNIKDQLKN